MPLETLVAPGGHLQPTFCSEETAVAGPFDNAIPSPRIQPQHSIVIMQRDQSIADENEFYQSLHKHSAMHRIVLSRPFTQKITLGSWVRLDLGVVNELGLTLKGDKALSCRLSLDAKLLRYAHSGELQDGVMMSSPEDGDSSSNSSISTTSSSSNSNSGSRTSFDDDSSSSSSSSSSRNWCSNSTLNDKSAYSIEIRPLQLDAWDSNNSDTDTTVTTPSRYCQNPEVPGFFCSGTGGLEFRVSGHYQDTTKAKYFLYISPTLSDSNSLQAMPLILGPIEVVQDLGERRNAGWFTEQDILNEMFRAYSLNRLLSQSIPPPRLPCAFALKDTYFLVKENWKMGTWGKAWDSALVLSDMFARQIWRDPQWLDGCHIVDLSAGTGCMALLLGYILGHLDPDYTTKFTLTDLEDALELIRYNYQLNFGNNLEHDKNISIQRLRWGSSKDAKAVYRNSGKPDIIIASDVLYEPNCFPLLVRSLALLSEPGKTVIYLGYKKRGLQDKDERLFFDMAKKHFHMEKIGKEGEPPFEYTAPVAWEKRHGFITRNAGGETDGMGWIDRLPDISNSKWSSGPGSGGPGQSNVQVYRMVRKSTPN